MPLFSLAIKMGSLLLWIWGNYNRPVLHPWDTDLYEIVKPTLIFWLLAPLFVGTGLITGLMQGGLQLVYIHDFPRVSLTQTATKWPRDMSKDPVKWALCGIVRNVHNNCSPLGCLCNFIIALDTSFIKWTVHYYYKISLCLKYYLNNPGNLCLKFWHHEWK